VAGEGSSQVPGSALDHWGDIVGAIFAASCRDEGAVRTPRQPSEKTHRLLLLLVVDVSLGLLGDVLEVLDAPNRQFFVLT